MIHLEKLSKSIFNKQLFEDISLTANKGDVIGIIGQNGCGKSTLLKIVADLEQPDEGLVTVQDEIVKAVPQQIDALPDDSINDYLDLAQNTEAWRYMSELDLIDLPIETKIERLSGGEKTKLVLIRAFSQSSTALLLDEPTNHLDSKTRSWLMDQINVFDGIVLVISHDREFLNTCATHIFEMDPANSRTHLYLGNYNAYLEEKALWKEKTQTAHRLQQVKKKKMEQWLVLKRQEASVHPDPRKGAQIRQMEKRLQREVLDSEIKKPQDGKAIKKVQFSGSTHAGKIMLRLQGVTKTFADRELIRDASFEIRGSDHVRLIGKNGSGKSTLLRMILGSELTNGGKIEIGNDVQVGYFAQQLESLDPTKSVIENFINTPRRTFNSKRARGILGAFLFAGDDIHKKVETLSYGERVRLQLAQMLNQENQLLLLDEPTNHLDIPSREVIERALQKYKGAMLVISHDEYFLQNIGINWTLTIQDGVVS